MTTDEPSCLTTLATVFRALGDPTRLRIFETLRCCDQEVEVDDECRCRPAGSMSVGEVCCQFDFSLSTISHHLKELRLAGLIRMEKRGRLIYCSVNESALELIQCFLNRPLRTPLPTVIAPTEASLEREEVHA